MAMIQRSGRSLMLQNVNQWLSIGFVGALALGAWFIIHQVATSVTVESSVFSAEVRYQHALEGIDATRQEAR